MKPEHIDHMKGWGPMYSLILVLAGGGGTAWLSDNIPVTNAQFLAWSDDHMAEPHQGVQDAIDVITDDLKELKIEGLRSQLRQAHNDSCTATGAALEYIDKEIERLEDLYNKLTGREYDPPPCPN